MWRLRLVTHRDLPPPVHERAVFGTGNANTRGFIVLPVPQAQNTGKLATGDSPSNGPSALGTLSLTVSVSAPRSSQASAEAGLRADSGGRMAERRSTEAEALGWCLEE